MCSQTSKFLINKKYSYHNTEKFCIFALGNPCCYFIVLICFSTIKTHYNSESIVFPNKIHLKTCISYEKTTTHHVSHPIDADTF